MAGSWLHPGFSEGGDHGYGFLRVLGSVVMSFGVWTREQSAHKKNRAANRKKKPRRKQPAARRCQRRAEKEKSSEIHAGSAGRVEERSLDMTVRCATARTGDGKGEMVESMKLTMKDWRDPAVLSNVSDGEIYDLIVKGKGQNGR